MKRDRAGFSMTEMLMVMIVMAVVLAFGLPKFNSLRSSGKVGSAKVHLSSSIITARAAAVQNSRAARWNLTGNAVTISALNGTGTYVNVRPPSRFDSLYAVQLRSTQATIDFDARGIASNMTGTGKIYIVGTTTDSVCITRLGVVLRHGCL